ncbi:hypothetical protein ACFY4C_22545 [Actinomadura viridis]|uniref:hypothetical protein n=1 Tax=Actinomadura viridis TaxID=58110 RepID=UPI003677511C
MYTRELEERVSSGAEDEASTAGELDTARRVLRAAREAARRGDPPGKGDDGAASMSLPRVIRFVADRVNAQAHREEYLFRHDANEDDLYQDLYDYLMSALGPSTEMEVQHIGGGRVDIRGTYGTFAVHLELKADDTTKPCPTRRPT